MPAAKTAGASRRAELLQKQKFQPKARRRWWESTVCCGFALHTDRSATQRYAFGNRLALPAKNVPQAHFLNAETLTGSTPTNIKNVPAPKRQARFCLTYLFIKRAVILTSTEIGGLCILRTEGRPGVRTEDFRIGDIVHIYGNAQHGCERD